MTRFAVRDGPLLEQEIAAADDGELPIAEVWRLVGSRRAERRLPQPSYETVRRVVGRQRAWRARASSTAEVMVDVALGVRPPSALLDHLAGTD
jgi:hypothetical protein